jgi:hypothetical protein
MALPIGLLAPVKLLVGEEKRAHTRTARVEGGGGANSRQAVPHSPFLSVQCRHVSS